MMQEIERPRFRSGESARRPYGGHVADAPFPQALYKLAASRGFESQNALAKALGKKNNQSVGNWFTGRYAPSPGEFGKLIIFLKPNDEELDALVEPYAQLLIEGKGINGRSFNRLEVARGQMRPSKTPIEQWVKNIANEKKVMVSELRRILELKPLGSRKVSIGLDTLSFILETAPQRLSLSKEQTEVLAEAVVQTIQQRVQEGHTFQDSPIGGSLRKMQESLVCQTYNASQLAQEVGVSRETVRLIRKKFDLPLLLTEDQKGLVVDELERTKGNRRKMQNTIKAKGIE